MKGKNFNVSIPIVNFENLEILFESIVGTHFDVEEPGLFGRDMSQAVRLSYISYAIHTVFKKNLQSRTFDHTIHASKIKQSFEEFEYFDDYH